MIMKPATHRVQNLGAQMAVLYTRQELQCDVSAYYELLQMQLDAVEDGDTLLAASIGKSMRQMREKHDQEKWLREFHRQDTADDF